MASAIAKTIVSDDAFIWAIVKKVLRTKGAQAAQEKLAAIRAEQTLNMKWEGTC